MKKIYLILFCSILLAGCLGPVKNDQPAQYVLNRLPHTIPQKESYGRTLLVLPPETRPVYNTTQMAYTDKPYQIAYLGKHQWAETPSQMLQPLIVQTLQRTHHYHAIVTPPYIGKYQYVLNTQLLELQQDFTHQPDAIALTIRAMITKLSTNQVVATKQFTIRVPISKGTAYNAVIAANLATSLFLEELAHFCLANS